jgi:hypothetical protein
MLELLSGALATIPRLSAALLALAAVPDVSAAQAALWQESLPASPIGGVHRVFLDGNSAQAGTMSVAPSSGDETEGGGLEVLSSPLGTGWLTPDGDAWVGTFSSGVVAIFQYDFDTARHEFTLPAFGASGFLVPASSTLELLGPQDPQGQGPKGGIGGGPGAPGRIDLWAVLPPWHVFHTIDFHQFARVRVRALRANPLGGAPIPEPLPPGTEINVTANGGGNATPQQYADGAGQVTVDGGTEYVDSGTGGVPGYTASGGAGGAGPNSASMSDKPDLQPEAFGPALLQLPNPLEIVGIEIEIHFTTYLVVDGQVMYVWTWTWKRTFRFDQGPPYAPPTVELGPCGPASGLQPDHQAAQDDYVAGGFNGAPNQ